MTDILVCFLSFVHTRNRLLQRWLDIGLRPPPRAEPEYGCVDCTRVRIRCSHHPNKCSRIRFIGTKREPSLKCMVMFLLRKSRRLFTSKKLSNLVVFLSLCVNMFGSFLSSWYLYSFGFFFQFCVRHRISLNELKLSHQLRKVSSPWSFPSSDSLLLSLTLFIP